MKSAAFFGVKFITNLTDMSCQNNDLEDIYKQLIYT
jgi:hypothetical protein